MTATPPEGFESWPARSPLLDQLGPLYHDVDAPGRLGFVVDTPKQNGRGRLHAGAISTIADVAIGHTLAALTDPPSRLVTVDLSTTFVGSGRGGDWVEVRVEPKHLGRTLASGTADFLVGDRVVAHASATFVSVEG